MAETHSQEEYKLNFDKAEKLRHNGQIPEAGLAFGNLLRYRLEWMQNDAGLPFTINEFFIIDRLADISFLTGNKVAAKHLLSALLHITKTSGAIGMRIHAVTKLMLVNLQERDLDTAYENARSLSDIIGDIRELQVSPSGLTTWENSVAFEAGCNQQDEADRFVCLYDALGALLLALGRFGESAVLFQRGIRIGELHRSPIVDARLISMKVLLAKTYFQKGEMLLAKNKLEEIIQDARSAAIASGTPIKLLELQAKIALAQGNLGEAYHLLTEMIGLCRQYSLPLAEIHATFNLAQTKIILNQTSEASDMLRDCLRKAEKLGDTALAFRIKRFLDIAEMRVQSVLPALNYAAPKQAANKIRSRESPVQNYQGSEDYLSLFEEYSLIFQMELAENNFNKADDIINLIRLIIAKCDSALIHVRFKVLEFMLLYFTHAVPSNFAYQPILDFLSANRMLPELWKMRHLLSRTDLISAPNRTDWIAENQRLLDQITNSLPAIMQAIYLLNKWSPNEEYLAGYADHLFLLKLKIKNRKFFLSRWLMQWKLLKHVHMYQAGTNRYKDHLARNIAKGIRPGDLTFPTQKKHVLAQLWRQPKDLLTISYLVLPDRVVIISRSFMKLRFHTTYINRVSLRQIVFALRDWLYPEGKFRALNIPTIPVTSSLADPKELLKHMGEILQLEIIMKEHGQQIQHISFVADDVFHGFPFTLFTANDSILGTGIRVSISTDDKKPEQQPLRLTGKKALLAGVSGGIPGLQDLPGVLTEIEQIDQTLQKQRAEVTVLLNEKTTPEEVKEKLNTVEIAHFACHGKFDFLHPDQSGLMLARGKTLTLKDILSLQSLSHIRLLVLSSCRGAEHFILPGRWTIGLPETFCRAGVHNILAFLWPVDDNFATAFTSVFYQQLENNPPAEAFRLTVLKAKNKEFPSLTCEYWHPKFWAGAIFYEN